MQHRGHLYLPFWGCWTCNSVCDAWPVPRQTYGYLSRQRALPLPLG